MESAFDTQEVQFTNPDSVASLIQSLINRNLDVIFGQDVEGNTVIYEYYNENESTEDPQPHLRVKTMYGSGMELIETFNLSGAQISTELAYES